MACMKIRAKFFMVRDRLLHGTGMMAAQLKFEKSKVLDWKPTELIEGMYSIHHLPRQQTPPAISGVTIVRVLCQGRRTANSEVVAAVDFFGKVAVLR